MVAEQMKLIEEMKEEMKKIKQDAEDTQHKLGQGGQDQRSSTAAKTAASSAFMGVPSSMGGRSSVRSKSRGEAWPGRVR